MTILGILNRVIFQWFFFRVAKIIDTDTKNTLGYTVIKWVYPLSGWKTDYRYINTQRFE